MERVRALAVVVAIVGSIFAYAKLLMLLRAKQMRALATKWGLQYIGPSASRMFSPPQRIDKETSRDAIQKAMLEERKISLPLPTYFPRHCYPGGEITQIWNLMEGQRSGVEVLVFDSIIGMGRRTGVYSTFIACKSKQNPFGTESSRDRVIHSREWIVRYRSRYLRLVPWTMAIQHLDHILATLRPNQ